jgi:hypothetical protein
LGLELFALSIPGLSDRHQIELLVVKLDIRLHRDLSAD